MAPGTHIGAAHPVSGTGEKMDETMAKKVASDAAAYARSLAEPRRRNVTLAAEAVTDSRAFTDREALEANPPLIDFVATDVDDVLRQLNGRSIRRFDGTTVTLHVGARSERGEIGEFRSVVERGSAAAGGGKINPRDPNIYDVVNDRVER